MIRTVCVATLLVTIFLAGCSNETPQHDFAFDLGGDDATPLLPSVVPAFDEAILAQRSVAPGDRAAPAPPPAPDEAPTQNPDAATPAFGTPAGGPSRPTLGGQLGGTGTSLTPLGQALSAGSVPTEPTLASDGTHDADGQGDPTRTGLADQAFALLQKNCFRCHGKGPRLRSDLDLRTRVTALKGGENGPALVPGNPQESAMYLQIAHEAEPHMPPKRTLGPESVQLVQAWIEAGAPWPGAGAAEPADGATATATDAGDQGDAPPGGGLTGFLRQGVRAIRNAPQRIRGGVSSDNAPGSSP